jgi:PKHD-type hydroxylase
MTIPSFWNFETDQIQTWAYMDNVFTKEECQTIIAIGNENLQKGTVVGDNKTVRDSEVSWLYAEDNMEWAFRRLTDAVMNLNEQFFKFDLAGFGEGFQFTKYTAPTGHYGKHIDKVLGRRIRKLSLTVQLSEPSDYDGGELLIQTADDPETMPKEQGKLIMFPSYVLHEVTPVTEGTRYSLVAWVTGKPFK